MLRRNPGFTVICATSLALGIGANAATLRIINDVLVQPLPFPNGDRVVVIRTYPLADPSQLNMASLPDFVAWRERTMVFDAVGASVTNQAHLGSADDPGSAEPLQGQLFTSGVFSALGVQPILGRTFTDSEALIGKPGSPIVISHALWKDRFGGDTGVVGSRIRLNRSESTIVGVMPAGFAYPEGRTAYWAPLRVSRDPVPNTARVFGVVARLKPGVTVEQAEAELNAITAQMAAHDPERYKGLGVRIRTLRDALYGWTKTPLLTLQAGLALVLMIACINIAGLLLARGAARGPEIALRMSLGAGRGRIVRQLLAESVLLAFVSNAAGLLVAWWAIRGLTSVTPVPGLPRLPEVTLDASMLALMMALSLGTGLASGLAPALVSARKNLAGSVREATRMTTVLPGTLRLRSVLVAAQIALALMFLIGAGLLVNSFIRRAARELNFDPNGLVTVNVNAGSGPISQRELGTYRGFPYFEWGANPVAVLTRVHERLRSVPGVESAAGISFHPMYSFVLPRPQVELEITPGAHSAQDGLRTPVYFLVTHGFFATMKASVVRGREFDQGDTVSTKWAAVVNETMARQAWPGEDPIGKHVTLLLGPGERPREVIGVIRDIPVRREAPAEPVIYASYLQQPSYFGGPWPNMFGHMTFVLRSSGDPSTLIPAVRRAVADIQPDRPQTSPTVLRQVDTFLRQRHAYVMVLGVFACGATLLAAVGIYGVLAYAVAQRTREIGIRIALGAATRDIVGLVGMRAFLLIATGLAVGLGGALALTRLLSSQLWGVTATDPATYAGVLLTLGLVAVLACYVPVRRALHVDPTVALKSE
jgi:putative ABC transport system permease protein